MTLRAKYYKLELIGIGHSHEIFRLFNLNSSREIYVPPSFIQIQTDGHKYIKGVKKNNRFTFFNINPIVLVENL